MQTGRWSSRNLLVGAVLFVGIGLGAAACGSSNHNPPATQTNTGATNTPAQTTPPTTAPSGGSVSY